MARTFLREGKHVVLRLFGVLGTRFVIALCLFVSVSVAIGAWRGLWFGARGIAVDGVVVGQAEELTTEGAAAASAPSAGPRLVTARRVFRAIVEFKAGDRFYRIRARNVAPVHLYPLGTPQVVVFPPGQPEQGRLRGELPDFWAQSALLMMAALIAAGAVRWWWWLSRRGPRVRRRAQVHKDHPAPAQQD